MLCFCFRYFQSKKKSQRGFDTEMRGSGDMERELEKYMSTLNPGDASELRSALSSTGHVGGSRNGRGRSGRGWGASSANNRIRDPRGRSVLGSTQSQGFDGLDGLEDY